MVIIKNKININFILLALFSFALSIQKINLPPHKFDNWGNLQISPIWIGWTKFEGFPICKAEKNLPFNIEKISSTIGDKINYPNIFDRITKVHLYNDYIIHIYLDMPFPISNRDYIVKYEYSEIDNQKIYYFYSVDHPNKIHFPNSINLPNAGGKWILDKIDSHSTKVTYIWNGELLGNFPDWALTKAWTTQGAEVLEWLNSALKNRYDRK